ncbi:MAG: hypothetical protein P8Y44_06815 [Acidobacteriota bacterium]
MDAKRFQEAYEQLQVLDDRLTYKVRPRRGAMGRLTQEQLEEHQRALAEYAIGIREILQQLFEAIAAKSTDPD